MKLIAAPDFDLAKTLASGQVFHWEPEGAGFIGAIDERAVYVEQRGDALRIAEGRMPSAARRMRALPRIVARYFALDHPLAEICASFPLDDTMSVANKFCRGLRILRQPRWECLATFICSSMKQVAHIRQISLKLRERFGERREIAGRVVHTFPGSSRLAQASEAELRGCGLGYRAKNLRASAALVASGAADLEAFVSLPDHELQARLCELPGVGAKVANCAMLFAYERISAFPIDVWIERVLRTHYFPRRRKVSAKELATFAATYFGAHGGYAQQYLFHHARLSRRRP
ncbi:MAG: DNA-3-methyladenine glycosylase 2 family protein [Verrucomicrobiota bacterium]|nr:DNA-3-methyladenine glycosylase 2 family protein [Verrucomicrobiota bacterium]